MLEQNSTFLSKMIQTQKVGFISFDTAKKYGIELLLVILNGCRKSVLKSWNRLRVKLHCRGRHFYVVPTFGLTPMTLITYFRVEC